MSLQCAEFLTSQDEDPAEYCQTEDAVAFRWKDDRWVRAQLLQKSFPNTVEAIFKAAGDTCPVLVDDEWREAYGDVSALADDVVEIHPDRMVAVRSTSRVESSIMTQIPEGTCSHWSVRSLDPVIAIATQWNPAAWPRPATFKGANFRGVVVGASTG